MFNNERIERLEKQVAELQRMDDVKRLRRRLLSLEAKQNLRWLSHTEVYTEELPVSAYLPPLRDKTREALLELAEKLGYEIDFDPRVPLVAVTKKRKAKKS